MKISFRRIQLNYTLCLLCTTIILSALFFVALYAIVDLNIGSLIKRGVITPPAAIHILSLEQKYLIHNLGQVFMVLILFAAAVSLVLMKRLTHSFVERLNEENAEHQELLRAAREEEKTTSLKAA